MEIFVKDDSIDKGCSFIEFDCAFCKDLLGRIYKTTNIYLDDLKELFSFYANKIGMFFLMIKKITWFISDRKYFFWKFFERKWKKNLLFDFIVIIL